MKNRVQIAACLLFTFVALSGCSHKQDTTSGGLPAKATPAQVKQDVREQAAKRAAYFNSHPGQAH